MTCSYHLQVQGTKQGCSKLIEIAQVLSDAALITSSSAILARREDLTAASSVISKFSKVSINQMESGSVRHVDAIVEVTVSHMVTAKELRKTALELINVGR